MEIYVIRVYGLKREKSILFKAEVVETDKTFRVIETPQSIYRTMLKKTDEYKPIGVYGDLMYGRDKEQLLREWNSLAELKENEEMARHISNMEEVSARLNVEESVE